jgi:hypothetical protein
LAISQADNRIRASTFGRGIWSSDLYTTCPGNLSLSGTLNGQLFYESSANITSTNTVNGNAGTKVRMKASQGVKLVPPFKALASSDFKANIGACETGLLFVLKAPITDSTILPPGRWMKPPAGLNTIVENVAVSNGLITATINTRVAGVVALALTDIAGNVLQKATGVIYSVGKSEKIFNRNNLPNGMYYVQAIHNNRLEHLQEIELR